MKSGAADCAVSAGNTGALMAMAKFCLHTMAPIERPAIAALQKWKFKPGTLDGVAIATKAIIPVKFVAAN